MSGYTFEKRRLDEIIAAADALEDRYDDLSKERAMKEIRMKAEQMRDDAD